MKQWFYTRGGQRNGPVTFEQLRELASSGGLEAGSDLVWEASMADWLPAGQVEGLFGASPTGAEPVADSPNPYAAPKSAWVEPVSPAGDSLHEIAPGSEPIDVGACLKRGFELTKRNFGLIFLVGLTYVGVSIGAALVLGAIDSALGIGGRSVSGGYQQQGSLLNMILSNILSIFLALGLCRVGLNLVSGSEVSVGMLFGEGSKLLRAIGASMLFGLMVAVGFLLLVIPGIYIMVRYCQFMYAIVDRDMGVTESLEYSSSLTTNNRMKLFVLGMASLGVVIAGALALLVGLIFAYPMVWVTWVLAYRWMQYGHRAAMDQPGTTTPMLAGV